MEINRDIGLTEAVNTTQPSDWRYLAEGSANLMIAYYPPPSRPIQSNLKNKCLRLRKRVVSSVTEGPSPHQSGCPDQQACTSFPIKKNTDTLKSCTTTNSEIEFIDFHRRIIGSLFGPNILLNFEPVKLDSQWLLNLIAAIEPIRPISKRMQECIDRQMEIALIMDNLTSNRADDMNQEIISVEIKPKWSFLPQAPNMLDPSTRSVKTHFCRTCVFRAVRSIAPKKHGAAPDQDSNANNSPTHYNVPQVNDYYISSDRFCALQLFNLDSDISVRHALDRLHMEWRCHHEVCSRSISTCVTSSLKPSQKHNNFKIFRDGAILDASDVRLDQEVIDLLAQALKRSNVLRRLDHLQKRLDPLDIEGIFKSLEHESGTTRLTDLLKMPIALSELEEILPLMSDEIESGKFKESFDRLTIRRKLIMYILSMTIKDCSIFVRFPAAKISLDFSPSVIKPIKCLTSEQILKLVDIRLIDLDLKPLLRLPTYLESDRKIFNEFKTSFLFSQEHDRPNRPVTCQELHGKYFRNS